MLAFQETIPEIDANEATTEGDERRRRKCFNDAAGKISRAPRRIDTKFWLQDKEKDKQRKMMTAKLFKGRKKIRFEGLSGEQEQKLIELIHSKSDETVTPDKPTAAETPDLKPSTSASSPSSLSSASSLPSTSALPSTSSLPSASSLPSTSGKTKAKRRRFSTEATTTPDVPVEDKLSLIIPEILAEKDERFRLSIELSPDEQHVAERLSDDFLWVPAAVTSATPQPNVDANVESSQSKGADREPSKKRRSTRRKSSIFIPVNIAKENLQPDVRIFFLIPTMTIALPRQGTWLTRPAPLRDYSILGSLLTGGAILHWPTANEFHNSVTA